MKILFDKNVMMNAIAPCIGFVSSKNTLQTLEGLHFITEGDNSLQLCAYDLEKGIRLYLPVTVVEKGDTVLNAAKFNQILRLMPQGELCLEVNENNVAKISGGKSEFEIHAHSGKDYPALPELSGTTGFAIPKNILKRLYNQTFYAVAQNDTRNALNSAYFEIKGQHIKVVACDGNRLAIKEATCDIQNRNEGGEEVDFSFMVYGRALAELMRLIEDKDELLEIVFGRKHIIFCMEDKKIFARTTEGEYIDYNRFIPKNHPIHATVDCDALLEALERSFFITEERAMGQIRSVVKLRLEDQILNVGAQSVAGRVHDRIAVMHEGDDIEIGFNCRLLLDSVRACGVSTIDISLASSHASMVMTPHEKNENENFLFLVLPVKMKQGQ